MISNGRSDILRFLPAIFFIAITIALWPFVIKYVWYPILADAKNIAIDGIKEGYNIFNTIYLSALFVYLAYLLFEYLKAIKIDFKKLFPSAILIGLLGGSLRALEDANVFAYPYNILFITPFIYLLITAYVVVFLYFDRKVEYFHKVTLALLVISFIFLKPISLVILRILGLFAIFASACLLIVKFLRFTREDFFVLAAHMLDASATFVGLSVGYVEKHVFPRFATSLIGPAAIYLLKFAVLLPLLYVLRERNDLNYYIKILILLLGLGPGFRNMLRISMGL